MKLLDRYVAKAVVGGTLLVLTVLLAMFTFFTFIDQLEDIGKGQFGISSALAYVLMTLPRRAFEIFPVAALIGSLLGLGAMASNSELSVMRASGVSLARITGAVMQGGALLMIGAVFLGEVVAPPLERAAGERRAVALSSALVSERQGLWSRDGNSFINIQHPLSDDDVEEVTIFEFDDQRRLRTMTHARRASYTDGAWLLQGVSQSELTGSGVRTRTLEQAEWRSDLAPDLIGVTRLDPDHLAIVSLWRYVRYLRANDQDSAPYEIGLWSKAMAPITTGVMIFLAVPFVFGPLRTVSVGSRILVGVLVGLGFHIANQAFMKVGLVYGVSPFLAATLPTLVFGAVAGWMTRRVA